MASRDDRDRAFVEYVAARRQHLRRFAYLLCGEWHTAEDLTQIALTKLYLSWSRVQRDGAEDAYARKTLLRCHLDERRRPWRRESAHAEPPEVAAGRGFSYEDREELRDAVRALPARQRAVLVLRYWWGLSIEETAHDLGCSTGTVKSLASRGTDRLRTSLTLGEGRART